MNDNHLYDLCYGKKWDQVRKFLDSDSNNKDKKRQSVCYQGGGDWTCLYWACYKGAPADIIKSLLDIGGKDLVMMASDLKNTALHYACCNRTSFDVMKMLIDVGGKELVVAKNNGGNTALNLLCDNINNHTKAANKIKLMLHVADTETILTDKNDEGKTPLDLATAEGTSDKIKALLQPRTIKNDPANASDDASNLVPDDDHDNNTTTNELQAQLQAANQKKIADLENQRAEHDLLATRYQDQLQAANQKNADLESEIKNQNVLLSELSANRLQDQAAYQKKIAADLDDKIETQQTEHLKKIAHLSKNTLEEKAGQDTAITYWKGRVDNLTDICSELKEELQQLKDLSRESVANAKRERDDDDDDDPATQSRSSKRSRFGSTTNAIHSDSENDVEAVMQDLLHERQKHNKLMMQFLEVRRELRIAKTQLGQQRNTETEAVN